MKNLKYCTFSEVDIADPFFNSLRGDYGEKFDAWFARKAAEMAYVFYKRKGEIDGFLYLKIEEGEVTDVEPPLPRGRHLKVGTLKINPHGTRLGERFVKKIFDHAIFSEVNDIYVTVYRKHDALIDLLKRYGFDEHGKKPGASEDELVLIRKMNDTSGDVLRDYPYILPDHGSQFLLAIYPEYHTNFLPDSKLHNEAPDILKDVSHTNSIHKIYISGIAATGKLNKGDILVMYRTRDGKGPAWYRSVATSICVVEEVRKIKSFSTRADFNKYVRPYSVFTPEQLGVYFQKKQYTVIKFTYNAALARRIIRGDLIEKIGLGAKTRWDFLRLTRKQFDEIVIAGELNANFIVN